MLSFGFTAFLYSITNEICNEDYSLMFNIELFQNSNTAKQNAEDGFSWEHYFRFNGVLELNPDIETLCRRTRSSIKGKLIS